MEKVKKPSSEMSNENRRNLVVEEERSIAQRKGHMDMGVECDE